MTVDPFINREILGGQFRIERKIGSGGMGSVYCASQADMNRQVAIKILHPRLADRSDLVSRFRREARAMSQLTHPNSARVFMYGELENDGALYIVMELLEGCNLNRAVKREGPMSQEKALGILIPICGALQEAHELGIVHRDLKPENIFLCQQGGIQDYPKVLDYGLAKVGEKQMRPGSLALTQEGMVFGTPEFMSPEQAQGKILDARSDIYSLAIILYEALTGKLPFDARTPMEFIQKHVIAEPALMRDRAPERRFDDGLEAVIRKALSKKPEDRYQSAAEFAAALVPYAGVSAAAYESNFGGSARPPGVTPLAPAVSVPSPAYSAPGSVGNSAHQNSARTPQTNLVIVAVVFLLVGVLISYGIIRLTGS